jgi:hypothetical protein
MTAPAVPTFDLTELSDHHKRLLTPENIEEVLSYKQLQSLGAAMGMQTVGMPKEELQAALLFAAQFNLPEEIPPHLMSVTPNRWFSDGTIPGGADWLPGKVRHVTPGVYKQLVESSGPGVFEVING